MKWRQNCLRSSTDDPSWLLNTRNNYLNTIINCMGSSPSSSSSSRPGWTSASETMFLRTWIFNRLQSGNVNSSHLKLYLLHIFYIYESQQSSLSLSGGAMPSTTTTTTVISIISLPFSAEQTINITSSPAPTTINQPTNQATHSHEGSTWSHPSRCLHIIITSPSSQWLSHPPSTTTTSLNICTVDLRRKLFG